MPDVGVSAGAGMGSAGSAGSAGSGTGTPGSSPSAGPGFNFNFGNNRYVPNTSVSVAPVSACKPIYDNQNTIDALNGLLVAISGKKPANILTPLCNDAFRSKLQQAITEQLAKAKVIGNTCSPANLPIAIQNSGNGITTPAGISPVILDNGDYTSDSPMPAATFTGPVRIKCDCPGGVVLNGKCYCQQATGDTGAALNANTVVPPIAGSNAISVNGIMYVPASTCNGNPSGYTLNSGGPLTSGR